MTSSFYLHKGLLFEQYLLLLGHFVISSLPSYAGLITLVPRRRLKAICRNRASMAFLIILGNLGPKGIVVEMGDSEILFDYVPDFGDGFVPVYFMLRQFRSPGGLGHDAVGDFV